MHASFWLTTWVAFSLAILVPSTVAQTTEESSSSTPTETKPPTSLRYGDGKADGKKSLGGSGQMIRFQMPDTEQRVAGLRIHAARYGHPQPPDEDIEISFLDKDETNVIASESVKYGKFKRGDSRWVTIRFKEPVELPEEFWVVFDFDAQQTKGVYVSYDTSTKGKYSRMGLPGAESKPVNFDGDWMIQLMLSKPKPGGE